MELGDWIMLGVGAIIFGVIGFIAWYQKQEKVLVNGRNKLKSRVK